MTTGNGVIRRRALRLLQDEKHPLYLFALRADELLEIADISRVSRDDAGELIGYQRPEVKKHVENIVEYLNSGANVLFPHAVILALDSTTSFQGVRGPRVGDEEISEAGTLTIRIAKTGTKPAWIVDGQQRALALARCKRPDLPVPVAAFVADDLDTQREQFLRVNTTRPLPQGLVSELLPKVNSLLPPSLAGKRAPAAIVELLHTASESPFFGLIRRSSFDKETRRTQVVTDTVLIQSLSESLTHSSGCLFSHRKLSSGETDYNAVLRVLLVYWTAVKETFPHAWGKPPTESRLMHSVGIRAMGKLMDRLMASIDAEAENATELVKVELARIEPVCRWTEGEWEELGLPWNKLEMTQTHLRLLSNVLVRAYLSARR